MSQDDLAVRLQSTRQLLTAKRLPEAVDALGELRRDYPTNPDVMVVLAAAHADGGDLTKAVECLNSAIAVSPNARTYYNLAMILVQRGEGEKATAALRKALELDPGYDRARQMLAQSEQAAQPTYAPPPTLGPPPQAFTPYQQPVQPVPPPQFQQPAPYGTPAQTVQMPPPSAVGPYSQPQPPGVVAGFRPMVRRTVLWKVIVGGLMVGLPGLLIWAGWSFRIYTWIGGTSGAFIAPVVGLLLTARLGWWMAQKAGAFETWDWVIMILLTGLIPSLLMIKGFDLIVSGYYNTD